MMICDAEAPINYAMPDGGESGAFDFEATLANGARITVPAQKRGGDSGGAPHMSRFVRDSDTVPQTAEYGGDSDTVPQNARAARRGFDREGARRDDENVERTVDYTVTRDGGGILSYYRDEYVYRKGDAHGLTARTSKTIDLKNCRRLRLNDILKTPAERLNLLNEIIRRAKANAAQNPALYFEDYERLIKEKLNPKNFYLSDNAIVVYFQQYDIGSYSSGILAFSVPLNTLKSPRPTL
ncbi:MAG: DUF3298 and DUF4163 domain-containing protein [Clostridiales bacterium]|jgi:hypothetical protein|nr:DUF3298 and DUF4163 domain-containing protein [Clostridiales bacterium]